MSKQIYKYVGDSYINKVFTRKEAVTLKCSYPKEFNDPYELFLAINFNEHPEALAFYADAVGDLPQIPTTCFSRSPSVLPMWAHYAQNLQGICIEFNEELLAQSFPESGFGDVDYRDEPDPDLTEMLYHAYETGKPRHLFFLTKSVFSAAYYTKASCWNYEQERRMLVRESESKMHDGLILMDIPKKCITALICGPRVSAETLRAVHEEAKQIGCKYFQLKIGKVSPRPFFTDADEMPFEFNGSEIMPSLNYCETCMEPILDGELKCSWCQIGDAHKFNAASRNPFRMLAHQGLLGSYFEGAEAIGRGGRKTKN